MEIISRSLADTEKLGLILADVLKAPVTVCFYGDLGAGKTTLTQSFARGLGITDYVTSPTFNIIKEYKGSQYLVHIDAYRISSIDEMLDLGFEDYLNSDSICFIEWAELIEEILPEDRINIRITVDFENSLRYIDIDGQSKYIKKLEERFKDYENTRN